MRRQVMRRQDTYFADAALLSSPMRASRLGPIPSVTRLFVFRKLLSQAKRISRKVGFFSKFRCTWRPGASKLPETILRERA